MNPFKIIKDWFLSYAIYILLTALVSLSIAYFFRGLTIDNQAEEIDELEVEVEFQKMEVELKSFSDVIKIKKGDTSYEVNATLNNTDVVPDGHYRLWE